MTNDGNLGNNNVAATNTEEEILVFTIRDQIFGVHVSQVKEILMPSDVDKVPHTHPAVEGVYMPRDVLITVVNLPDYMGIYLEPEERTLFIVADTPKLNAAFRVTNVLGIQKFSVDSVEETKVTNVREGVLKGIVRINGKLISLINFEEIVEDIAM